MSTTTLSERVVARTSSWLGRKQGRRSFLIKSAVVGSALAVNPFRYILKPGTAEAALGCGPEADCGSGWSAMCCSINGGQNTCPPGSLPGGWWKVDNSGFCHGGPRYYIDCNASCGSCGCGASGVCSSSCNNCGCHCASGSCDQRLVCCNQFRYGQCHQDRCVGAVVCRVISCAPPWEFDGSCSRTSATSPSTAAHDAPCLHTTPQTRGRVYAYGRAAYLGQPATFLKSPVTGMDATPSGKGYWLVADDGGVFSFGDAKFHGSTGALKLKKPIVDLSRTPTGNGYWLVASDGGIFTFGDAKFFGSTGAMRLNQPVVGMAHTPTGKGYWLVASDGGIFTFGDAKYHGSTGSLKLKEPIVGMASTPSGKGYWLVASDGGIFTFGDAKFYGSLGATKLRAPIVSMARAPGGTGYWMLGLDGGVFTFGTAKYFGSLALDGSARAVDLANRPQNDGYWIGVSSLK
jgi:ribosomal protein L24E